MGWQWRQRRVVRPGTTVNLSKSGASVSKRIGRVTVNSRGRVRVRLGRGLSWRL